MDVTSLFLIVAIFGIAYLGIRNHNLKETVEKFSSTNDDLSKRVAEHVDTERLLKERLTECADKVESYRVLVANQAATIEHHEKLIEEQAQTLEKKSESTQYPTAPPDITKGVRKKYYGRDSKGHFVKK